MQYTAYDFIYSTHHQRGTNLHDDSAPAADRWVIEEPKERRKIMFNNNPAWMDGGSLNELFLLGQNLRPGMSKKAWKRVSCFKL